MHAHAPNMAILIIGFAALGLVLVIMGLFNVKTFSTGQKTFSATFKNPGIAIMLIGLAFVALACCMSMPIFGLVPK